MGLSNENIISYFKSGGQISKILIPLEKKLSKLKHSVDELKLLSKNEGGEKVG